MFSYIAYSMQNTSRMFCIQNDPHPLCFVPENESPHRRFAPRVALNFFFFQVGVCGPDFRSVGLTNWYCLRKRGLVNWKFPNLGGWWTENFQIWGLVSWKFPNLGAWELKFGQKLSWAVEAKISKFSQKGVLWTDPFA